MSNGMRPAPSRQRYSKAQLLLGFAVFIVFSGFVTLAGLNLLQGYRTARQHAFDTATYVAMGLERELGQSLEVLAASLEAAVQSHPFSEPGSVSADKSGAPLFDGSVRLHGTARVSLADANGDAFYTSHRHTGRGINLGDRSYFLAHSKQPGLGLTVTAPVESRVDGQPSIVLSRRLDRSDGSFGGVAIGALLIEPIQQSFQSLNLGKHSNISLLGTDGILLARWPGKPTDYGRDLRQTGVFSHFALSPAGTFEAVSKVDGVRKLFAYRQIGAFPLIISVGLSSKMIADEWWANALPSLGLLVTLLMVLLGLIWALRREWLRRAALEQQAKLGTQELVASAARLESLFQHSPDALEIVEVQEGGGLVWEKVSPPVKHLYDVGTTELVGRNPLDVLPTETAEQVLSCWRGCVDARHLVTFQYSMAGEGGRREIEKFVAPIFGENGRVCRLVGGIRDVTQRNQMERSLRQSQKLEIVGQLTAGVAHDFNNLLQAIIGGLDMLDKHVSPTGDARQCLSIARTAAFRGASLTSRLLTVSRKQELDAALTDLSGIVRELTDLCTTVLGPRTQIETHIAQDLWPVLVDPSQMTTCLMNLAVNARDAMPDGGKILITVRNSSRNEPGAPADLRGDYVVARVQDDGIGMTDEILASACDPFFTTKETGKGSGLGLSMVQGFAAQSGGAMTIRSTYGVGTVVEIWLPRAMGVPVEKVVSPREILDGHGRVLLVDDDLEVGSIMKIILEESGYSVTYVSSGEEAITLIKGGGAFDVLLSDYAMPGMNGGELVKQALRLVPNLPALIITGYNQTTASDAGLPGSVRTLHKPIRRDDLLLQIRAEMSRPAKLDERDEERSAVSPSNVVRLQPRKVS